MRELTTEEQEVLDEIVHDVASETASNAINSGEQEEFLTSNGWTEEQILSEIERRA